MNTKKKFSFRKFTNDIHLWLGLLSGIILFLVCLSGSILTFEDEIKNIFAKKTHIEPSSNNIDIDELTATIKSKNKGFITGLTIPDELEKPYVFTIKKDLKERRGSTILVNPYTQQIIKLEKNPADNFLMTMFKLHRWLLLDVKIGRPIVGIATIIFLILSVSGIILWFPKKIKWKKIKTGFKIKTTSNWKRINYDLHNTLGFYACIIIVIMSLTGLAWSFESYRNGLGEVLNAPVFGNRNTTYKTTENSNSKEITLKNALNIVNNEFDYSGKLSISFPNQKNKYFQFRKYDSNSWSPETNDKLIVDVYGNVLHTDYFKEKPLNVQIAALIKPLHTGKIFGTFSKIIYFLACLIATSLPVTGTIIWLNQMKKKKGKN